MVEEKFAILTFIINSSYTSIQGQDLNCPEFSIYRLMGIFWRRIVLDPIRSEIHDTILKLFQTQRKRTGSTLIRSDTTDNTNTNDPEYLLIK